MTASEAADPVLGRALSGVSDRRRAVRRTFDERAKGLERQRREAFLEFQRHEPRPRDPEVEAVVRAAVRGLRRIVSRSGREPHMPLVRSGDLRGVGFVAAHEPAELSARFCRSSYRQQEMPYESAFCNRAGRSPECPRGRARTLPGPPNGHQSPELHAGPTMQPAKEPRAPHRGCSAWLCAGQRGGMMVTWAVLSSGGVVTCDRPAGLECLEPRGLGRRCKTRWLDSCCPMPTDRTPGRSLPLALAARQRHAEREYRKCTRSSLRSPGCTSRNHRRRL